MRARHAIDARVAPRPVPSNATIRGKLNIYIEPLGTCSMDHAHARSRTTGLQYGRVHIDLYLDHEKICIHINISIYRSSCICIYLHVASM